MAVLGLNFGVLPRISSRLEEKVILAYVSRADRMDLVPVMLCVLEGSTRGGKGGGEESHEYTEVMGGGAEPHLEETLRATGDERIVGCEDELDQ
ncbi:hypothetical protein Scep_007755 [Stephania cephalantha]|uniref:Uncharacterized protein n=1 Tax=Stephania cephalantha TaxID=152367 RepID=A0AAP0KC96_9MAGN